MGVLIDLMLIPLTVLLYVYAVHTLPITLTGFLHNMKGFILRRSPGTPLTRSEPPNVSIVMPAKNEERVIGKSIESVLRLKYPKDRLELIIVEDSSIDKTREICEQYVRQHTFIKLLHLDKCKGKPEALNEALKQVSSEFMLVIDADTVLEPDSIERLLPYFNDRMVAAVTGVPRPINYTQSLLTRLSIYEVMTYKVAMFGKQVFNFFLPVMGFFSMIRRKALNEVSGWDADSITEDFDLGVRLSKKGYVGRIEQIYAWQEVPANIKEFLKQRVRWYRGCIEVAIKHKDAWRYLNPIKSFDLYLTMFSPTLGAVALFSIAILLMDIQSVLGSPLGRHFLFGLTIFHVAYFTTVVYMTLQEDCGKASKLLLIPMSYLYSFILSLASVHAIVEVLLKRPRRWLKTEKTGYSDKSTVFWSS